MWLSGWLMTKWMTYVMKLTDPRYELYYMITQNLYPPLSLINRDIGTTDGKLVMIILMCVMLL